MTRRETPVPLRPSKTARLAQRASSSAPAQSRACRGAAAQLSALHFTLRRGPPLPAERPAAESVRSAPTRSGGDEPVVQRIAWHEKDHGKANAKNSPAIDLGKVAVGNPEAISVAGYAFQAPVYRLPEQQAADKPKTIVGIAGAMAGLIHPAKPSFLKKSQLENNIGIAATVPFADLVQSVQNPQKRNIYLGGIDPYIVRAPGAIQGGGTIAIDYQFGADSYGYIVRIEQEGKSYGMDEDRGQEALAAKQRTKLDEGSLDDPLFEKFASAHDTANPNENIADLASEGTAGDALALAQGATDANLEKLKQKSNRLDAVARIGGEGARWRCVRNLAEQGKLTNNSLFYTAEPEVQGVSIGMTFQVLWGRWASNFGLAFDIADDKVAEVIEAEYVREKQIAEDKRQIVTRPDDQLTDADYDLD